MNTYQEVLDAAKSLSPGDQREFVRLLAENIRLQDAIAAGQESPFVLPDDFTERLTDAFHQARLNALRDERER